MTNRSRLLPRLVAVLPVVALLWSCRSGGQVPFNYPEELETKVSPEVIEIQGFQNNCVVEPDRAVVNVKLINLWNPHAQVLWHTTDKQNADRVVISAKPVNDPAVQSLFQSEYEIPDSFDAIRSGSPRKALKLLHNPKGSVVWQYQVDYFRDGKLLCTRDPTVCIQKWGSTVCQSSD